MFEPFTVPFFQRVLLAGVLTSIACGVMGTYVVVKRMASISGGVSHAAFGGIGLGYLLGFEPMWGATGFALMAGLGIGAAHRRMRSSLDTLVSMMWSVGMALGILFVSLAPGYAPDLSSYLFGSILFVPWHYVALVALLDVVVLLVVAIFYRPFQAVAFDEEFAQVAGLAVEPLLLGLLALTSLTVVTLIRVVGIILVVALLTIPAATARLWSNNLRHMMVLASATGACCTILGLLLSFWLAENLHLPAPPGPLIILLATTAYGLSFVFQKVRHR